jgi:hypothetical protein
MRHEHEHEHEAEAEWACARRLLVENALMVNVNVNDAFLHQPVSCSCSQATCAADREGPDRNQSPGTGTVPQYLALVYYR